MASSIKLQVNHNKHPNKGTQSDPKKPELKDTKQPPPQNQPKQPPNANPKNNNASITSIKNDKSPNEKKQGSKDKLDKSPKGNKDSKQDRSPPKNLINRIESSKRHLFNNIQDLIAEYRKFNDLDVDKFGHNPEKEAIIKKMVDYYRQEKKQRRLRKKEEVKHRKEIERRRQNQSQLRQQKKKDENKKSIVGRLSEIKKREGERSKQQQKWDQFYEEFKKRKPLFMNIQEEERQKARRNAEDYAQKLKLISLKYQPLDEDEFIDHVEKYERDLEDHKEEKQLERKEMERVIDEENQMLRDAWKGRCHRNMYYERQEFKLKKEEPKMKRQKMREYHKELRMKMKKHPKTVRKDSSVLSLDTDDAKSQGKVKIKREKFEEGKSMGFIDQFVPKKKTELEQRNLGNMYLDYLKKLPKKQKEKKNTESDEAGDTIATEPPKKKAPLQRVVRDYNPLYDDRGKIQSLRLPRNANPYDLNNLFSKIKRADHRIDEQQRVLRYENLPSIGDYHSRQKQINERLFRSVQHKIGLLDRLVEQQKS